MKLLMAMLGLLAIASHASAAKNPSDATPVPASTPARPAGAQVPEPVRAAPTGATKPTVPPEGTVTYNTYDGSGMMRLGAKPLAGRPGVVVRACAAHASQKDTAPVVARLAQGQAVELGPSLMGWTRVVSVPGVAWVHAADVQVKAAPASGAVVQALEK